MGEGLDQKSGGDVTVFSYCLNLDKLIATWNPCLPLKQPQLRLSMRKERSQAGWLGPQLTGLLGIGGNFRTLGHTG